MGIITKPKTIICFLFAVICFLVQPDKRNKQTLCYLSFDFVSTNLFVILKMVSVKVMLLLRKRMTEIIDGLEKKQFKRKRFLLSKMKSNFVILAKHRDIFFPRKFHFLGQVNTLQALLWQH